MQFTIQTLLLATLVVWASLAAFGVAGIGFAVVVLGVVAVIRSVEWRWTWRNVLLAVVILLILVGLLLPAIQVPRESHRQAACMNNLKQLALALLNYHSDHGHFPPACVTDADGKPMHSWRVLILPYMEGKALYDQYDFDEPWDGPNNSKLADQVSWEFDCPNEPDTDRDFSVTNYVAVVGPRTVWRDGGMSLEDIPDGGGNTIMLVEVADSKINWMQPTDLSWEEALGQVAPKSSAGIAFRHTEGETYFHHGIRVTNAVLADSSLRILLEGISPKTLEALLTIDGGESIDLDGLSKRKINWTNCTALVVLVVSILLLLLRPRRRSQDPTAEPAARLDGEP